MDQIVLKFWIEKMKTYAAQIVIAAFCLAATLYFLVHHFSQKACLWETEHAEEAYNKWRAGEKDKFSELLKFVTKNSSLEAHYCPLIAQQLLLQKQGKEAESFVKKSLRRFGDQTPYHQRFAATSLVIAKGNFTAALDEAKKLKEDLAKMDETPLYFLQAYNLLRIALIQKEIGTRDEELQAWTEVEQLSPPIWAALQTIFQENSVSLSDFIKSRK